jgi:hypothetical protein
MSLALCRGCGSEYPESSLANGYCYPCWLLARPVRTHRDWATGRALARKLADGGLDGLREHVARCVFAIDGDREAL